MFKDIDVLPRTLFKGKFMIRSRSAKENTVQRLSVTSELWFGGLKARKESFAFLKETCWYGEKWPVVFDVDGKEGEPTVIQKAFHADPRLRLSRTGSKCGALGWEWPPANRATRKVSTKKIYRFIQKCLATTGSRVFSASLKTFACPWLIPVSNRSSNWWKAPRFLVGLSASDAKYNQNIM